MVYSSKCLRDCCLPFGADVKGEKNLQLELKLWLQESLDGLRDHMLEKLQIDLRTC